MGLLSMAEKEPFRLGRNVTLVIHGGAGTMSRKNSTPEQRYVYKAALADALRAGYDVLRQGGEAMDAAVAAVSSMEDNPLFNSGKGAVFNSDGKNELEASIMLSKPPSTHLDYPTHPPLTRRGLSATLLTHARNPSKVARALYLRPDLVPHPFVSAAHAEDLARDVGEELVDPYYFFTEARWKEHRRGLGLPDEPYPSPEHSADLITFTDTGGEGHQRAEQPTPLDAYPTGTVGAVALDSRGCIAAVTSTGGKTNKLPGRIGDTPVMGAGFWAEEWKQESVRSRHSLAWLDNTLELLGLASAQPLEGKTRSVGVSGTGDGDYFIRQATASTVARHMQLLGESLKDATERVVEDLLADGGIGGVIALDGEGNVAMPLNCPGMYRGVIKADGVPKVAIFKEDGLEDMDSK